MDNVCRRTGSIFHLLISLTEKKQKNFAVNRAIKTNNVPIIFLHFSFNPAQYL